MGVRRFIKGRRRLFRKKEDLHGGAHGVEEVDDDEGEDGQPLLPCEGGKRRHRHSCVLLLNGLKIKDVVKQLHSPCSGAGTYQQISINVPFTSRTIMNIHKF